MRGWILALETGTSRIVVAAGREDGTTIRAMDWPAEQRHGERLLAGIEQLMAATALARGDLRAIVVGTGPGAFTGLRVGLATAKTLAHELGRPIVGVGTGEALLRAAASADGAGAPDLLVLPAGPRDRVVVRPGLRAELVPEGAPLRLDDGAAVAVDLEGRAPVGAVARGAVALAGLGPALIAIGAARLRDGEADDADQLVPEYVSLPRGAGSSEGVMAWSRDPR